MELVNCPECFGQGRIEEQCGVCDGGGRETCYECGGDGREYYWNSNDDHVTRPCRHCSGTGVQGQCLSCASRGHNLVRCEVCGGIGKLQQQKAVAIVEEKRQQKLRQEAAKQAEVKRKTEEAKKQEEERTRAEEAKKQLEAQAKAKWEADAPLRAAAEKKAQEESAAAKRKIIKEREDAARKAKTAERNKKLNEAKWVVVLLSIICFVPYAISQGWNNDAYALLNGERVPTRGSSNPSQNVSTTSRGLTEATLRGKTNLQLDIMRNQIYARRGLKIGRRDLATYFQKQSWYKPNTSSASTVWNRLTAVERRDVAFIARFQKTRSK